MIPVSSAIRTALDAASTRPRWLVDIGDFDTATNSNLFNWTTHHRDITIGGVTWDATGYLGKIPTIKRSRELKAHSITLTLNAIDAGLRDEFLNTNPSGQPAAVHLCLLDKADAVIGNDKITHYRGLIDTVSYSGGKTLTLSIQSPFAKPSQTAGRLISSAAQKEFSPGDRFMDQAHQKFENLEWGGKVD